MACSFTKQDFLAAATPMTLKFRLEPKHFKDGSLFGFQRSLGRYPVVFGDVSAVALPTCIAHFQRPPSKAMFKRLAKPFDVSIRVVPYEFNPGSIGWHGHQKHTLRLGAQDFKLTLNANVPVLGSRAAHGSTTDDSVLATINPAAINHHLAIVGTPAGTGDELLKIPGIGPCVQARLKRLNITTRRQLENMSPAMFEDVANATGISGSGVIATIREKVGARSLTSASRDANLRPVARSTLPTNSGLAQSVNRRQSIGRRALGVTEKKRSSSSSMLTAPKLVDEAPRALCAAGRSQVASWNLATGVKRLWRFITGRAQTSDSNQLAIEGPPAKRQKVHPACVPNSAQDGPQPSTSNASEDDLHPALQALLADARGESGTGPVLQIELPGFQLAAEDQDHAAKRAEALSEVNRILATRTADVLGNGSPDMQKQEYKRLLHLLHPDKGVVDKDDRRAALALQLCFAAKKRCR